MPSLAALRHQVSPTQQAQMLGNGRPRHRESAGDLPGGLASLSQEIEYGAAGGIGERVERRLPANM